MEDITMKKYIAPRIRVAEMAAEDYLIGHSFDWADVKKRKTNPEEELWDDEEEVEVNTSGIPSKLSNIWDKTW